MKEREIHLFDYFLVLRRRRWVLLSTFLLVIVSAGIVAYQKPEPTPQYEATTTLVVKPDRPALVNIRGSQPFYQQYFDESVDQRTQLQILKSRVIIERVVNELNLMADSSPAAKEAIMNRIRRAINVVQVPGTYLVKIVARRKTPQDAQKLANTMAEVYIEYNLQTKLSSARKTLVWLNEQIVDLRGKVQKAYKALSTYQNQNQILSLEMSPEMQARKLSELNNAYERARQERIEAETRLEELRKLQQQGVSVDSELAAVTFDDPIIDRIRTQLVEAKIEKTNLLQSYKSKHPKVKHADLKLETLQHNLAKAISTLFKKLETDVSVLRAKENNLAESVAEFKNEALEMNTKRLEYSKLKGEVASTEELYNMLFRQLKETSITEDLEKSNISILESANQARDITPPLKREQTVAAGAIIGVFLGIGLAFLFEYFDKTLKNPEDVEQYLGLPVLGTIPKIDRTQEKVYGKPSPSVVKKKQFALQGGK